MKYTAIVIFANAKYNTNVCIESKHLRAIKNISMNKVRVSRPVDLPETPKILSDSPELCTARFTKSRNKKDIDKKSRRSHF